MSIYENAIFLTIAEDEGLYNYFKEIYEDDRNYVFLVMELKSYYDDFSRVPYLYRELVRALIENTTEVDFWVIAENLVDLFNS